MAKPTDTKRYKTETNSRKIHRNDNRTIRYNKMCRAEIRTIRCNKMCRATRVPRIYSSSTRLHFAG